MEADGARPEQVERFRERRDEAGIEAVVCHALYLVNLAGPDSELHAKSVSAMRATLETAAAIGAEAVVFHVGSHLGAGLEEGLERVVPALRELLELTDDRLWLVLENAAGAGGRSAAPPTSSPRSSTASTAIRASGSASTPATGGSRGSTSPIRGARRGARRARRPIGLDRLRCLHVNDAEVGLGSNRDRHASLGLGAIGDGLATFLAHPAFQGLPAILETPGPDGTTSASCGCCASSIARGADGRPGDERAEADVGPESSVDGREDAEARALERELEELGLRQPSSSTRCS